MSAPLPSSARRRLSIILVASACSVAALSAESHAQPANVIDASNYEQSGWVGAAFYEPPIGRFDYCRQGRVFEDGTILTFTLDGAGFLDIGLVQEDWAREPGTAVPMAARLDDYGPVDLVGIVDSPTAISVPVGDNPEIVEAFRRGNIFEIVGEDFGPLSFALTGTSASLSRLRNCVVTYRDIALTPTLGETGRRIANALADYPEDIRRAVLDATAYPDLIAQVAEIQDGSSTAFRDALDSQPQDVQTLVWRVVRYPDLVDTVLRGEEVAGDNAYPESAIEAARELAADHGELIDSVRAIRVEAEQALGQLLRGQPLEVEATFRTLLDYPEIMAGMAQDLGTVEQAGELWAQDREAVWQALELTIAEIDGAEAVALERWQEQIASDPEAAAEMVEAADAYVAELSATDPAYAALNTDPALFEDPSYAEDPYPYWYGPPPQQTGDVAPSWYPAPYYQDTGYSYTNTGELLVTGLVSVAFAAWLFDELDDDDEYWWGRYPHFSEQIFINVEDNIVIVGDTSGFIDDWRDRREPFLPDDWFDNDGGLADRLDELGDFEREFRREERRRGEDGFDRGDFLTERGDDFPRLEQGVARDSGLRERFAEGDRPTLADGGGQNLSGVADRLGGETAPLSGALEAREGLTRDLAALQGGPNTGDRPLADYQTLDQQLGSDLAGRLTGGGQAAGGQLAGGASEIVRNPERVPFDRFNGDQFSPTQRPSGATEVGQRDGGAFSGGGQLGHGGLFGSSSGAVAAPATPREPRNLTGVLPRSGGGFTPRNSNRDGGSRGGGNFQRRFR